MFPEIENPKEYAEQINEISWLYRNSKDLSEVGINLVSTDEKTGIQALEKKIELMKPGILQREDSEYTRHGTCCLIANLEISSGKIISPSLLEQRTEVDFANHISKTIKLDKEGKWVFIVDNLNTHKSETLVKLVAEDESINLTELGKKGVRGILKDTKSRMEFLKEKEHRISFVYTPKHTSWMNQVEIWFSILVRKLLKRSSFKDLEELKMKIIQFIEFFNKTMAKPFKWNYKGIPLTA